MIGIARAARIAAATFAALLLGGTILSSELAHDAYLTADYEAAGRRFPLLAQAAAERATARLSEAEFSQAEVLALRSIAMSPLNSEAATVLALVRAEQGRAEEAEELMAIAAAMSWANETAQLSVLAKDDAAKDFERAVLRTDALLRQRFRREEMFVYLRELSLEDRALKPITAHLAMRPRWRRDFLEGLSALTPGTEAAHQRVLMMLQRTNAPPDEAEINAFLSRLVAEKRFAAARSAWARLGGRASEGAILNDRNFRRLNSKASPFEWTVNPKLSSAVRLASDGALGLHIEAEGRPAEILIEQLVSVRPGPYAIVTDAREGAAGSLESLRWQVSCAGGEAEVETSSPRRGAASTGSIRFEQVVIVPDCPAQRLALRLDHDRFGRFDVWLEQVAMRPLSTGARVERGP